MRLDKPIGILAAAVAHAVGANGLASNGRPDWLILWIFVMGVVLMRSAGCVITTMPTATSTRTWRAPESAARRPARCRRKKRCYWRRACPCWISADFCRSTIWYWGCRSSRVSGRKLSLTSVLCGSARLFLGIAFGFGIPMSYAGAVGRSPLEAWILLAPTLSGPLPTILNMP